MKITNVDGTTTQADITQFMNVYTFSNSDEVAFEVTGTGSEKTVSAMIRANSIGLDKLSLSVVSTLEGYMTSAKDSATAAKTSETNARTSELNAQEAANTAVTKAQEATTSATSASESADEAEYWAKQAQGSSRGGDMLKSVYDVDGDGVVDDAAKLGGELPSAYAKASHNQAANTITAGTLAGKVVANASAVANLTNSQVRNIKASTADLTAGTSALTNGDIYLVYE